MKKLYVKKETYSFIIIMIISMLVRLYFIHYTSVYDMQHDAGTPNENYGHLGYIAYFMQNHHLPDFDVREAFQFWHPPLHHIMGAVFLNIVWNIFPTQIGNYEPLQLLSFVYITVSIWIIWKLLRLWNLKGKELLCATLLVAFHPTFITLSGSVNNDALCVMFTFLSIYFAILWYRNPSYRLIIACALSIGLGMSTKGMSAMAAFPMAFIFLAILIRKKGKVIGQLFLFAAISLPLGLWWYIRNYINFDVPVNYIYYMSTDAIGYLGNIPLRQRILDFDLRHFSFENLYLQFEGRYTDSNPIIGLLKTAVFGQWRFNYNVYIKPFAYLLLFIWIALVVISLLAIPEFLKKAKRNLIENISILILFTVQFISYYHFCISYPFVWTMDFRYAVPLLLCHCLLIGYFIKEHKRFQRGIYYLCLGFTALSVGCFFLLSFTAF